jgi:hypothetical protein
MHRYDERSNDAAPLPLRQFYPGSIITTGGYNFREGQGKGDMKAVCKLGLEGIVSKKLDAPYKSGPSRARLKSKTQKTGNHTRC